VAVIRIKWPAALATLFVILLGWYLLYTQQVVEALEGNAQTLAEIFGQVQGGISTGDPNAQSTALFNLQRMVIETGIPIVLTAPAEDLARDTVIDAVNLPFEVDLGTPEGQQRVLEYAERLDLRNDPVGDPLTQSLHFGDPDLVGELRRNRWLQVAGLLLVGIVGFTVVRAQRRTESERAWAAMARELAHQLGTPISSLQGWLEVLRIHPSERPGDVGEAEIAGAIEEDLIRLGRISRRFELIGREPKLESVDLHVVVGELERYLRTRLPKLGPGVELSVSVPSDLPRVQANAVLLTWALENLVKNSLDALAGRGGWIALQARREGRWVDLRVEDSGSGVRPDIRDRIFDAGVSTKSGGWGVGLALARRIVEGLHGGRIELLDGPRGGATFQVRLPVAGA
jgi:signal transduction histidine kinase